jgi:hypothetical protein
LKSAFLNGILQEEFYVDEPPSYEVKGQEDKKYKLRKSLYGLNQDPRASYSHIDSYIINSGFNKRNNEPTLYTKSDHEGKIIIIFLCVDDMIYTCNLILDEIKVAMKT